MLLLPDFIPTPIQYLITGGSILVFSAAALLYTYQCDLIYAAHFPPGSRQIVAKPHEYGITKYEDLELLTKDHIRIRTYICKQFPDAIARNAPTILYLHANAGNMGHRLPIAKKFYLDFRCNVVMLSYRGYGLSEGKANEKGIRIDAQTILNYIKEEPVLKHTKIIVYGQSVGGAVAIDLVARNEDSISALIVENTFLSIPRLIPSVLPHLRYFTFLCHQIWPSETSIKQISHTPILFLTGARDELVPPWHMRKLHELATTNIKVWKEFSNGTHNDTVMQSGYFEAIKAFLEEFLGLRGAKPVSTTETSKTVMDADEDDGNIKRS